MTPTIPEPFIHTHRKRDTGIRHTAQRPKKKQKGGVHASIRVYVCMYVCMYVYMCVCICIYVSMRVRAHTYVPVTAAKRSTPSKSACSMETMPASVNSCRVCVLCVLCVCFWGG
jgi:hypothetical protein